MVTGLTFFMSVILKTENKYLEITSDMKVAVTMLTFRYYNMVKTVQKCSI